MARDWKEYLRSQEIKVVPIGDVKPYPNNPRDNEKAVPAVAASIDRFGFRNPILVDGDGSLVIKYVLDEVSTVRIEPRWVADRFGARFVEWKYDDSGSLDGIVVERK